MLNVAPAKYERAQRLISTLAASGNCADYNDVQTAAWGRALVDPERMLMSVWVISFALATPNVRPVRKAQHMSTFQSFWHGELSLYETLAMKSFLDHGHEYVLYAYEPFSVPEGVTVRDANVILPRDRIFYYQHGPGRGSIAGFTNLFRYALLFQRGGWWIDTDVVCLSDQIAEPDIFLGAEERESVGSAILRFPPGHAFMAAMYQAATAAGSHSTWGLTGPKLLTQSVAECDLHEFVRPPDRSYPVRAQDALHLVMPAKLDEIRIAVKNSPFLHMWNEIFRRAVLLKCIAPPGNSYLAELFQIHELHFQTPCAYTADQVERLNENFQASLRSL